MKVLACKTLPARAEAGVCYLRAGGGVYVGLHDNSFIEIGELFSASRVTAVVEGPRGEKGDTGPAGTPGRDGRDGLDGKPGESISGPKGERGTDGKPATIRIGRVETLPAGAQARVENSGTATDVVLNFFIPVGATGAAGSDGESITGPQGPAGDITVYGDAELRQAVQKIKAQMIERHAKMLAAIENAMRAAGTLSPARKRHFEMMLSNLKREAGL